MKRFSREGLAPPAVTALALALAALAFVLYLRERPPGEGSVEAGFARDMSVHHAQAVEMAGIVRDRTRDPALRTLATDIVLTQQAQIGQMHGWLAAWGLPLTGTERPMSWMGHTGGMPGMATPEEINRLRSAPPEEADRLFLRLMIEHHRGAIPMARAALERTDRPEVERLAEAILRSQRGEIQIMQEMLEERGGAEPADRGAGHHHGG
ncbi:DUF305 domain-containing protein [Rubrobacter xylanophilus]|uniref:DUF305 domain-containing protein n=1 Tax=Rubrobacter xylanophilus TaxID=49319 RepID=A0A510HQ09_9ACTN|nr:DUF305 domain-containing protein [Rubrobacter xylanophilus]BBL81093.1 DUF305 domain-containing protein [Rubrobacter xylanophilus]